MHLVKKLPVNRLDIVGDIHGEIDALKNLMVHLGYDPSGNHPDNRKLVFLGDLIDRGPDSLGVVRLVQRLIEAGNAYAILGNHELNLLIDDIKDGSGWFFPERYQQDLQFYAPFQQTPETEREAVRSFLNHLPVVLERDDIRIVHAAWTRTAVEAIRSLDVGSISEQYDKWDNEAREIALSSGLYQRYLDEKERWKDRLEDGDYKMPMLENIAQYEATQQMINPFKVLTSGVEQPASTPFFAGNRWRFSDRVKWWDDYDEGVPVVIGHYWRIFEKRDDPNMPRYTRLFSQIPPASWHGKLGNVLCIDYSAGARWRDRRAGRLVSESRFRLAALRWPENVLMFDSGEQVETTGYLQKPGYA